MHILGIDPGFSTGGLVLIDTVDGHVVVAISVSGTMEVVAPPVRVGSASYALDIMKCRAQAARMVEAVKEIDAEHGIDHVAIENFIDLKSKAKKEKAGLLQLRWKTPLVLGAFDSLLIETGFDTAKGNVSWQNPAVIDQMKSELGRLKEKANRESVVIGGSKLTNDHMRKAWAHAEWCATRLG